MSTATESEHLHDRPHWLCRECGRPWPCPAAQASLLEEYRAYPSLLKIYLSAQMYDALADFTADGEAAPLDLYERFLAWAGNRPLPASPSPSTLPPPAFPLLAPPRVPPPVPPHAQPQTARRPFNAAIAV